MHQQVASGVLPSHASPTAPSIPRAPTREAISPGSRMVCRLAGSAQQHAPARLPYARRGFARRCTPLGPQARAHVRPNPLRASVRRRGCHGSAFPRRPNRPPGFSSTSRNAAGCLAARIARPKSAAHAADATHRGASTISRQGQLPQRRQPNRQQLEPAKQPPLQTTDRPGASATPIGPSLGQISGPAAASPTSDHFPRPSEPSCAGTVTTAGTYYSRS